MKQRIAVCHNQFREKHSMPSGTNTFIPAFGDEKEPYITEDGEYKVYPKVSIFEEDEEHTPERLQEMVIKNNRRFADRGTSIPLVIGHTSEDDEENQRPVVGWSSNLQLGDIGDVDPKKAIYASFQIPVDNVKMVEELYPRVSIEEYADGTIDPIALLGATTPHFDVGFNVGKYEKNEIPVNRYQQNIFAPPLTIEVEDMDKDALVGLIAEVIDDTEVGQYVRQQMEDQSAEVEDVTDINVADTETNEEEELTAQGVEEQETQTEEVGEAETEATDIADEEKPEPTDGDPDQFEEEDKADPDDDADVIEEDEEPTKNEEGEEVEKAEDKEEPEKNEEEEDPEKHCEGKDPEDYPAHYSKEQMQNTVKRYQKALAEKDAELSDLKQRYSRVEREGALTKLHNEFTFDMEEEMEHTADMSDLQFTKHVNVIRKRYSKAPVGKGRVESIGLTDAGGTPQFSLDDKMRAVRYASENSVSFEDAMKKVK